MKKYEKSTEEIFLWDFIYDKIEKKGAKSGYGAFYNIIMHSESLQRVDIEMSTLNHIYKQLYRLFISILMRKWLQGM